MPDAAKGAGSSPGMAADSAGNVAYDPSANVLSLVEAAVHRLDDLRDTDANLSEAMRLASKERSDDLRAAEKERADDLRIADRQRSDDALVTEKSHIREIIELQATHSKELAIAEANRINAIRAVDVAAVATANERATQQATVLANQVATSAETLRALVASTNASNATALQNIVTQFTDRITLLERSLYENRGRAGVTDPAIEALKVSVETIAARQLTQTGAADIRNPQIEAVLLSVKELRESQANRQGSSQGTGQLVGWIFAGLGVGIGLFSLVERALGH